MNIPVSRTSQNEVEARRARIGELRAMAIDPYPAQAFKSSMSIREALLDGARLVEEAVQLKFAGRLLGLRRFGGGVFADLVHDDDRLQIFIERAAVCARVNELVEYLDLGDFVGVEGHLFITQRGETTLRVASLVLLGKSLLPLPIGKRTATGAVHQALGDQGRLLRERHVALMSDRALRNTIIARSKILRSIRKYFESEGFVEVETPILSRSYGGAAATPFVTESKALGTEFYLRVSPECSLKRALCGGISKVFEMGKNFRNEGIDHSHSPEFTAIEWYEAFTDYHDQMIRFENLVSSLAMEMHDSHFVRFRGRTFDFTPPWPRLRVLDTVADALGMSPVEAGSDKLFEAYRAIVPDAVKCTWGEALMALFEMLVEPEIIGPAFVIDHPVEVSPLTKRHRLDSRFVERFEPFVAGMEIGNAYSELNDPIEQRERLAKQDMSRTTPYGIDEDFLVAVEHGMPQAGGAGLGVDRVVMILTDSHRLSEVILFPMA